jgi:DNA replication protein DnaC
VLLHPVIEKLKKLNLHTMATALKEQQTQSITGQLSFEERLGLLVDMEATARDNKRLAVRLKKAKFKEEACVEDIDLTTPRGLDKGLFEFLSMGQFVKTHHNLLITGPCGAGKTYLACALAHKACLIGNSALYEKLSKLLSDLHIAQGDGRYKRRMDELSKVDVLILDDFGLTPFIEEQRRDLLEILDERYGKKSTIVTSQLPVKLWHETIGNGTLADAILDRLVHEAYRLEMKGACESMRKIKSKLTKKGEIS